MYEIRKIPKKIQSRVGGNMKKILGGIISPIEINDSEISPIFSKLKQEGGEGGHSSKNMWFSPCSQAYEKPKMAARFK